MKTLSLLALCSVILVAACNKNGDDNAVRVLKEGVYTGTFTRTGMDTAEVKLYVQGATYRGESNIARYPAICAGSHVIDGNTISFTDTCARTADFDWTLILDGNFSYEQEDDTHVRFWKTNNSVTDEYRLRRLVR